MTSPSDMYCRENIYSYNRSLYAEQNEQVEVISVCLHLAIVEGKRGRFPVLVERLSEDRVLVVLDVPEVEEPKAQLTLF